MDSKRKYYAVAIGKTPGIYLSWNDCKEQVNGYSGAVYKGFTSLEEAQSFVSKSSPSASRDAISQKNTSLAKFKPSSTNSKAGLEGKLSTRQPKIVITPPASPESKRVSKKSTHKKSVINIYTDGSHSKGKGGTGYLGFGGYCKHEKKVYKFSQECTPKILSSFDIKKEHHSSCSNPTAELLGFGFAIRELKDVGPRFVLRILCDYRGVEQWMTGSWKCNEPYIAAVRDYCLKLIKKNSLNIEYVHVDGHSGHAGNEEADTLAKCRDNFSNFDKLRDVLVGNESSSSISSSSESEEVTISSSSEESSTD